MGHPPMVRQAHQHGSLCVESEKDTLNSPKSCSFERYLRKKILT